MIPLRTECGRGGANHNPENVKTQTTTNCKEEISWAQTVNSFTIYL